MASKKSGGGSFAVFLKMMLGGGGVEEPKKMAEWRAKFDPILVEGLTDGKNYIRLQRKETPHGTFVLAFRPLMQRVEPEAVLLGGKLSLFIENTTVAPVNEETAVAWLEECYPSVPWSKRDGGKRLGTNLLSPVKAPLGQGKQFLDSLREAHTAEAMLKSIEEKADIAAENRKQVLRAMYEAFDQYGTVCFDDLMAEKPQTGETADVLEFPSNKTLN